MAVNKVIYGTTVLVDLTEDTVTADKLLQGYTAHDKSGALITGTASATGGVIQDQDGYLVLDDDTPSGGGGGATNCVCGTFTTSSTTGAAQTITIPYTGSGFPMVCIIYLPEGYSNGYGAVHNTVHQYGIVYIALIKNTNGAPAYTSGTSDYGYRTTRYKTSETDGTAHSSGSGSMAMFSTSSASGSTALCARFNSSTQLSVYVNSAGGYGLIPNTQYAYCIGYSS